MKSLTLIALFFSVGVFAAETENTKNDTAFQITPDDGVLMMIDSVLANCYYNAYCLNTTDTSQLFGENHVLIDTVIESKMELLNQRSPIDLRYNEYVHAFINLYANKKRALTSNVLGLIPVYYPMFEEVLDRYNLPLELKHLAVVESALNPSAKSRVGAQGLWQFMYRTGKMYGLSVDSYCDDRMDPYKATVAACEYLSDLYGMYGNWSLVLAAYNSGPGNVNKAIRRSGGKKDFWEISRFLPRETRGYVPAFIAVNYVIEHHEDFQLYANENNYSFKTDTIQIEREISFEQLSAYLKMDISEIAFLNPQYKLDYIPKSKEKNTLCLPIDKAGIYLSNEVQIHQDIAQKLENIEEKKPEALAPSSITHTVRSGEFLGSIAKKYSCGVNQIMDWNNKRSTRINPGDKLLIYTARGNEKPNTIVAASTKTKEPSTLKQEGKYQIHVVRSGDTLWDIAKEYNNISVNDLKRLNSHLNFKQLKPGMAVRVKQIS